MPFDKVIAKNNRVQFFCLTLYKKSTQRAQTSANAKIWTKSDPGCELGFSNNNPDFRINLDSDPDAFRICPKMWWMHYLVGVSRQV